MQDNEDNVIDFSENRNDRKQVRGVSRGHGEGSCPLWRSLVLLLQSILQKNHAERRVAEVQVPGRLQSGSPGTQIMSTLPLQQMSQVISNIFSREIFSPEN